MPNKYTFYLTPLAEQDIESALEYISQSLCNGQAAVSLLDKIESAIELICEYPYSSSDCKYFLISDEKIRHVIVENYVLIYEVKDEQNQINVLRFRYSRMNFNGVTLKEKEE